MDHPAARHGTTDRAGESAHRAPMALDERGEGPTIAAAVDLFFGDLRLAPRTKKTYWHGIAKFLRHLSQHEGIDPETAPVSVLRPDHVTSFAAILVPRHPYTGGGFADAHRAEQHLRGAQILFVPFEL